MIDPTGVFRCLGVRMVEPVRAGLIPIAILPNPRVRSLRHALAIALLVFVALPILVGSGIGVLAWPIVIFAVFLCVGSWISSGP